MKKTDSTISTIASLLGARGGKSKSPQKVKAARESIKKARATRLAKLRLQSH